MPDHIQVIVTLRKTVEDIDAGKVLIALVKVRMADKPDVQVDGHVTARIEN